MQEELATLMTQRLRLDNDVEYHGQPVLPPTPPQRDQQAQVTYITQHYHHSAHQAAPTPPVEQTTIHDELARHGVDTSALFPSQLNLFKEARPEQQLRLIQLWTIAPPSYGNQMLAKELVHWPQTSMQQEEEAAKARSLRTQAQLGNYSPEPRHNAEPYIMHGYEELSDSSAAMSGPHPDPQSQKYSAALDPVYRRKEWWLREADPIEYQYGVVQQMRQFADQDEDMS